MPDRTTPLGAAFELQRRSFEGSRRAFESTVEANRRMTAAFVAKVDDAGDAQRRTLEAARSALHGHLAVVETTVPEGALEGMREAIDQQFDALAESHAELVGALEADLDAGAEAYDAFLDDSLAALDDQFDALLEANHHAESQAVETVEQLEALFEELAAQFEAHGEEFERGFGAEFERWGEQLRSLQSGAGRAGD